MQVCLTVRTTPANLLIYTYSNLHLIDEICFKILRWYIINPAILLVVHIMDKPVKW